MKKKQSIITFKVDEDLRKAIEAIPNRSEFIRSAVAAALGCTCPLCNGSGMLSRNQKRHWDDFLAHHSLETCNDCKEKMLVCAYPH